MDLNSDLGEAYRRLGAGRRPRAARRGDQRERGVRVPRRRPGDDRADGRAAVERGVAVGAQVSLPRPGRLRPARDGRRPGRPDGRRALPARRARGVRRVGREPGPLREAARRALQPHRASTTVQAAAVVEAVRRYDPALPLLDARRVGAPRAAPAGRRPGRGGGLRRPGLHRRRRAGAARRAGGGAAPTRPRSWRGRCGWCDGARGVDGRRRQVAGARSLAVRARRHPGRGRAGAGGARAGSSDGRGRAPGAFA